MARIPPALWLLCLAVGVSWALKEEGAAASARRAARANQAQTVPIIERRLPDPASGVARIGPAPATSARL